MWCETLCGDGSEGLEGLEGAEFDVGRLASRGQGWGMGKEGISSGTTRAIAVPDIGFRV